ncbi:MAG: D-alanyl-D-alanine carboxypeptidase [Clostridiales bacterium]|nr:D-alanyl-D-alanine carboxypeptidase [Clostridiales bacterium]
MQIMENRKQRIIKTLTAFVFAAALALTGAVPSFAEESHFEGAPEGPDVSAEAYIVMDAGSGQVLCEKNGDEQRDPASVTKVLNFLVCLDTLDFNEVITVDRTPDNTPSTMHLQKGETIKIEDLIYCMMLSSNNDAAEELGYLAGGDMETFAGMMNEKAAELGAQNTKYKNPNGLNPDPVNNLTTPHDIAIVMSAAMKDERFRTVVGTKEHLIPATNKYKARKAQTSNKCLWDQSKIDELAAMEKDIKENPPVYVVDELTGTKQLDAQSRARVKKLNKLRKKTRYMVEGCIGGKTGWTSTAGGCYTGYVERDNMDVVIALMDATDKPTRFKDAVKLWDYAYDNFDSYTAEESGKTLDQMKVKRGSLREVKIGIPNDLKVTTLKGADPSKTVTTELTLNEEKPMAPIKKGEVVGKLVAYDNGVEVSSQDVISLETAEKGGPLSYIGIADEDVPKFLILFGLALLTLIIIIALVRASRKKNHGEFDYGDSE